MRPRKPVLVGEANFDSHARLARYLGAETLAGFDRAGLCAGAWDLAEARRKAAKLRANGATLVLLGTRVCRAFRVEYAPLGRFDGYAVLRHPAARLWSEPAAAPMAREVLASFRGRYVGAAP